MFSFLITADSSTPSLTSAITSMGGKPINANCWIAYWGGTADGLCHHLRPMLPGRIVVCALSGDWSYR